MARHSRGGHLSLIEASSEPSRPVRPLPTRRRWRFDRVSAGFAVVLTLRVGGLASLVMRSIVRGGTLTDHVNLTDAEADGPIGPQR